MWICIEIKQHNHKKESIIKDEEELKDFLINNNLYEYYEKIKKLKIKEQVNTEGYADYFIFGRIN